MPSTLSAGTTPYATSPHVSSKGGIQHPVSFTGTNAANPMASALHQQHNMQTNLPPQMRYNREAPGAQSMNMANGMFRSPVAGSSSVTFGNVGLSRAAIAEQNKYMYAPSPLSQMPVYCPPPIMEGSATRTVPMAPPEMRMPHHPAPMAGYMSAPIANGPMRSLPVAQQQPPHIHQQSAPGVASNGQEALMNFIPNHDRYSGTISNNPLMRDLNKLKQFSAKDYSSRPTLLAEVDSRQLAKRNMPGLGGSTCHSFQPEAPPLPIQPPQQQFPPAGYHSSPPPRPQDRNDHETYYGHPHDQYYSPRRGDPAHRKQAPRQDSEEKGRRYSSSFSDTGNKRRTEPKTDRSRSSRKHRDQERGRDTYGGEYEGKHVREFRQRKPYQRTRGRSTRGRTHHRRYDDKDYDHFDYDDYSDSYASEYYEEWDCDSDDYYDDRVDDARHHRRRSSKYRSRVDAYREPVRAGDGRRRKQRHADAHDSWHKPHRAPLDDPRDSNRMGTGATKGAVRQGAAIGSEQTIDPHAARQRSQFGRILANIKRGAPAAGVLSGKSSAQNSPVPKERTLDNHIEENLQKKNSEKETCNDNDAPSTANATEDAGAYPVQTAETEVAEESTAETGSSPSTANCPTPTPVNAAIVAAN
ncbi:hypothetical protein H4S08_000381 [Coemansia sp. RSA 1365]|nr:hypothetical protein H4S08_000381 [Coemansia sp. RSA 1365]